ncbi:hypothetical protein DFH09DRAFT_1081483 [Mycena vulgaris]|nr:hypothetical protein DFH09DRAFT_1081483 [Mycena vulgaris]
MKLFTSFLGLALISAVSAINVFICRDPGFKGSCVTYFVPNNQCINLTGDHTHAHILSAFGPSPGMGCTIFVDPDCGGTKSFGPIRSPGYSDLSVIDFNDQMSSFLTGDYQFEDSDIKFSQKVLQPEEVEKAVKI